MGYGRARFAAFVAVVAAVPGAGVPVLGQSAVHALHRRAHVPAVDSASADFAAKLDAISSQIALPNGLPEPTGATESSGDLPKPFAAFSASARNLRDSLVALARAQIGKRYRLGGTSPRHGFDCSGLVRYVMAALHVDLPRTAHEQAQSGTKLPRDTALLRPGDLVTFGSTRHISHIGIYVGDGRFVQASSKAGRVIETPLERHGAGVKPWRGARRMPLDSTATTGPESDDPNAVSRAGDG
jgi:cell wall-associated NlpC family hydrolase